MHVKGAKQNDRLPKAPTCTHTQSINDTDWCGMCLHSRTCLLCFRAAVNSMSSQPCRPISTQSITSTDSADSEENYVAMVSPNI